MARYGGDRVLLNVFYLLGYVFAALAAVLALPIVVAIANAEHQYIEVFFVASAATAFLAGGLLFALKGQDRNPRRVDLLLLAALSWGLTPVLAAAPFLLSGTLETIPAALFEAVSGLTTSGGTAMVGLESLPRSIVFWRALLEWSGGAMTLLTVLLVLAPAGLGGTPDQPLQMFESGATLGRKRLSIMFAKVMPVYLLMTLVCFIALAVVGLPAFDAFNLALSTLSTGGFTPRGGSLAIYGNWAAETVIGVFMLIGASSILWQRLILTNRWQLARRYREGVWILGMTGGFGLWFAAGFYMGLDGPSGLSISESLRKGLITAASLVSTTGMEVREGGFNAIALPMLLSLVLLGGGGYSTAGGLKLFRTGALFAQANRELARLVHPHGIRPSRIGTQPYNIQIMKAAWSAFMAFLVSIALLALAVSWTGIDFDATLIAAVSAISNVGQLYEAMRPVGGSWPGYAEFSGWTQLVLAAGMLVGRLEILAFLALIGALWVRS